MSYGLDTFERNFEDLEELADMISRVLNRAVTIEDANHKLISYSSHHTQTDSARLSTIVGRRVPEKIIQALWRDGILSKIMASDGPVRVSAMDEIGLGDRIVIAIRKDTEILGYIWVAEEDKKLDEASLHALVQAAEAARTKLLQLKGNHRKVEQDHQNFFWQLLTGTLTSVQDINAEVERNKLRLPALYGVHVVQFSEEITGKLDQQLRYMMNTLFRDRLKLSTTNKDQFIVLEDRSPSMQKIHSTNMVKFLIDTVHGKFGFTPITGGSGSVYDNYTKVEASYKEALIVMRMKEKFPQALHTIFCYEDLGYYRFLPDMQKNKSAHPYTHAPLRKLEQYDLMNKSHLFLTLKTYLAHNMNLKQTASILHIHQNTLIYRLKRIAEVSSIDLDSMDEKITCYLEMKLQDLER